MDAELGGEGEMDRMNEGGGQAGFTGLGVMIGERRSSEA